MAWLSILQDFTRTIRITKDNITYTCIQYQIISSFHNNIHVRTLLSSMHICNASKTLT